MLVDNPVIIIPYRNRAQHLSKFLAHYRKLLPGAYYVISEQNDSRPFNRGALLNCGFMQTIHLSEWFIFHDVDMLCDHQPDYSFTPLPTMFATACSQFNYKMPFPEYFGGVVGFSREHFSAINGYPLDFWGWGGEDNSLYYTTLYMGLEIAYRPHRYFSLPHPKSNLIGVDRERLERSKLPREENNGISGLKYLSIIKNQGPDYLHLLIDIQ